MALMLAAYAAEPVFRSLPGARDEIDDRADSLMFERRHDARVRLARPIRVIDLSGGRHIAGRSRDLSHCGMRVEIPLANAIRVGEIVQVDVGTLSGIGPLVGRPRVIPARVVWTSREQKMLRPLQFAGLEFEADDEALVNVA